MEKVLREGLNVETTTENKVNLAAEAIHAADALLVTAGAGMGVDSGLPDFRGAKGFWRTYPAIAKLGLSFEEMANPVWFSENPHLAWAFYGHRLNLYRRTTPHPGFSQLLLAGEHQSVGAGLRSHHDSSAAGPHLHWLTSYTRT